MEYHESISDMFDVKFPRNYKYNIFPFQFDEDKAAYSGELQAKIKKEGQEDSYYIIKFAQTYGNELTVKNAKNILEQETIKYEIVAEGFQGEIVMTEDIEHKGFFGKYIYIVYDQNGTKYGLRTRIYMTNYGKIEQTIISPNHAIFSYKMEDFFNSLAPKDGRADVNTPVGLGWEDHKSNLNIFTAVLPPENKYYAPQAPTFKNSTTRGKMSFMFTDPIIEDTSIFYINSYKFRKEASLSAVRSLLHESYIKKYMKNASMEGLELVSVESDDGSKIIRTAMVIPPLPDFPHITSIQLEARYKGNSIIVQEFLSSGSHAGSDLAKTLFSLTKFHPEKYRVPSKQTQKDQSAKE